MSETSQGPGWWQASDGKWYPPTSAPGTSPAEQPNQRQPGDGQPSYGQPPHGQPPHGQPPYGQPPYGQPPFQTPRPRSSAVSTASPFAAWGLAGGALLAFVGSFLPWATLSFLGLRVNVAGTRGDGKLTLILGLAIGVGFILLFRNSSRAGPIVACISAVLALIVSGYDLLNITSRVAKFNRQTSGMVTAHAGYGLFVVVIGAAVSLAASVVGLIEVGRRPRPTKAG